MTTKIIFSTRLDKPIIDLLRKIAAERKMSQAAVLRELILKAVYK